MDLETGVTYPARCRCRDCSACLALEALGVAAAIAMSAPDYGLLVTAIGSNWPEIQRKMNRFREYLGRAGVAGEWCYHVEPSPSGDEAAHVHVWRHGPPIPRSTLLQAASSAGVGIVFDKPVKTLAGSYYGLKEVIHGYIPGQSEPSASQKAYMALNGGRLVHASRDFWRDRSGAKVKGGVRKAISMARTPASGRSRHAVMTASAARRLA